MLDLAVSIETLSLTVNPWSVCCSASTKEMEVYFTKLANSALVSHAYHPKCRSGPPAERDLHSFKPLRKETKGIVFSDTGSLYKNQISTLINIILLVTCFFLGCGCFQATTAGTLALPDRDGMSSKTQGDSS